MLYENNAYKFNVSNSTNQIIDEITVNSELTAYGIENSSIGMGGNSTELKSIDGSINLNKSYIKVNNEYVWKGVDTVADLRSNALAVLTGNCGNTFNASNLTGEYIYITSYFGTANQLISEQGSYTAPADGIVQWTIEWSTNSFSDRWFVSYIANTSFAKGNNLYNGWNYPYIECKKGQTVSFHWNTVYPTTARLINVKFWYAEPNNLIFETLYPIGSIYIGTMQVCPLQLLGVGTWKLVGKDKVLQGAGDRGNVGTELDESLPNITGFLELHGNGYPNIIHNATGSLVVHDEQTNKYCSPLDMKVNPGAPSHACFDLDASKSSATYKNNAPVQQDAYLVNIWERIA